MLKTIITFIIVFGVLVISHEFGHFYAAKKSGILVREFAIGMGPKLLSFRKNGTTYTWRLLPIGGYVRMAGNGDDEDALQKGMTAVVALNDESQITRINVSKKALFDGVPIQVTDFDLRHDLHITGYAYGDETQPVTYTVDHDATIIEEDGVELRIAPDDVQFESAPLWKRIWTNAMGPINNFILAIVLFIALACLRGGVPKDTSEIGNVQANSVAQQAGIRQGDVITSVNHKKVSTWQSLSTAIGQSKSKVDVTLARDGKTKTVTLTPEVVNEDGKSRAIIGIQPAYNRSLWAKIKFGFTETIDSSMTIFRALGSLVTGFSLDKLGGPVAMFKMSETAANQGLLYILAFIAVLSVNLGIINLLPIPALDGGKLVLNIYEALCGHPLDPKKEGILTAIGFGCVLLLMILVTWNDLQRYFF